MSADAPPAPEPAPDRGEDGSVAAGDDPAEIEPDPRFSYANERTFLAWIRTALGLITAGLAVTQLFPEFDDLPGGRRIIGLPLIALGVLVAVFSFGSWQRNERAMRRGQPLPRSHLPRLVAVVVAVVSVLALLLAVFDPGAS